LEVTLFFFLSLSPNLFSIIDSILVKIYAKDIEEYDGTIATTRQSRTK
jgi:hypothetical protein